MQATSLVDTMDEGFPEDEKWIGFEGKLWEVHKFGGTSVASAKCYNSVAQILEDQLDMPHDDMVPHNTVNLAVVVSGMGGKPKVTDLLLRSVKAAAARDNKEVDKLLDMVLEKHTICLQDLFGVKDQQRLLEVINADIEDIKDILKTVSLMKWQAKRISELVSGYGELWSAQILSTLLQNRADARFEKLQREPQVVLDEDVVRHHFVYVDAKRVITVDEEEIQDGAVVWETTKAKMEEVYETELAKQDGAPNSMMHLVITGYVASNTEGVATTLQRDGSDYSAAIIGRILRSSQISIWTDVDGVLSADPRRVPMAHPVSEISYNEAMELAYFGAKVIHPKTMEPAISSRPQIPIYIRNTFNPRFRGTRIHLSSLTTTVPEKCVCGFSSIEDMAVLNLEGSGLMGVHGVSKRLFGTLEDIGVNVVLISQASSEHTITFAIIAADADRARLAINEEFQKELARNRLGEISVVAPTSIIAAVGEGMTDVAGVSGRFFSALGDAQINVLAISQGCSERNISAVVSAEQSTRALRALHAAFHLSHTNVRVAVVGMNPLGRSLLRLLEAQRRYVRTAFDVDLQVCTVSTGSTDTSYVYIEKENSEESITVDLLDKTINPETTSTRISFEGKSLPPSIHSKNHSDLGELLNVLHRSDTTNHVIFDCTNDEEASRFHPEWLSSGVHVITANNTGLSGSSELREAINMAESVHGRISAKYMREVTVGGGLPIINTIRTLLSSGDKVNRVDGIFTVAMSFLMYRVSPPPNSVKSYAFDEEMTDGGFRVGSPLGARCSFSQALKEAIELDLTESNPEIDLRGEYTARMLMVLAKELGLDRNLSLADILSNCDTLDTADEAMEKRVAAAEAKGCVLRHVGSIDVATQSLKIRFIEVPNNHVFAVTPPTSACVRFFTRRYQQYPLVVQGPAAGADCTSSALLAEVLTLMRNKIGPKNGNLSRTSSSVFLK